MSINITPDHDKGGMVLILKYCSQLSNGQDEVVVKSAKDILLTDEVIDIASPLPPPQSAKQIISCSVVLNSLLFFKLLIIPQYSVLPVMPCDRPCQGGNVGLH